MKIRIKKWVVYGTFGIIPLVLGMFLITVFFEGLNRYGTKGYAMLAIFLITGFFYWQYEKGRKEERKIIDEVAEKVSSEYQDKFDPHELETSKSELKEHLIRRNNEDDVFIIQLPFLKKQPDDEVTTYPDIPDVVKQEFIKRAKK